MSIKPMHPHPEIDELFVTIDNAVSEAAVVAARIEAKQSLLATRDIYVEIERMYVASLVTSK